MPQTVPASELPAMTSPGPTPALPPVWVVGYPLSYQVAETSTATRTNTPLIDIPQTVQAVPASLLHDQAAHSIADVMRNVPGVYVAQGEGNRDQLFIRGVKTKSDFFIDGMRDDTEYYRDLYNVKEVDVLQGPAALLFGRGNAGGLVNLVTKEPERTTTRHVTMEGGSYGFARGTLDLGDSLGTNGAFRLNAMAQSNGGDGNFRKDYFEHRYGIDPEFKFWLGNETTFEIGASRLYERQLTDRGIPAQNGRPANVKRTTFFGSPTQNYARATVDEAHARVTHKASDQITLRDTLRFTRNDKFYQNMFPGSALAPDDTLTLGGYDHANTRNGWFNHAEMVYTTATGALDHKWLVGFDTGYQRDSDRVNTASSVEVSLANPTADGQFDAPKRDNDISANFQNFYVQDQVSWATHWKALLGIGWQRFSVRAKYHLVPGNPATKHTDTAFTPRAGIIYQPVANASIYASVSRTYTPQGANLAISLTSPSTANLDPETATNYEIGNKLSLLHDRLALSAALFQLDMKHVVTTDPNDPTHLVQTGAQRNRGFEFSATGQLTQRWSLAANYAYLDARITSATKGAPAGAIVGLIPYNQASVWTRYHINQHWGIAGGVVARSRVFTSFDNQVVLPGYARVDAMAYYQNSFYRLQLNLENLFDRHYYGTAEGDNQIMPGAPRSAMLRLSMDF